MIWCLKMPGEIINTDWVIIPVKTAAEIAAMTAIPDGLTFVQKDVVVSIKTYINGLGDWSVMELSD